MKIESKENSKVKQWIKLKEKKYRDKEQKFLIEGDHLVKEAIKKDLVLEIVQTKEQNHFNIPTYIVTNEIMKKLSSQMTTPEIIAICKKKEEQKYGNNILILDCIQDPGNLGTIIRSAVAFSFDTILLSKDTVDLYNEKVIRSTEGMIFHQNIIRRDIFEEIPKLKKLGYTIYGTNVVNGKKLKNISFSQKKAIIIGNEGKGMNKNLQEFVNENIYIPMNKQCESLNAAICASIIMYESGNQNE